MLLTKSMLLILWGEQTWSVFVERRRRWQWCWRGRTGGGGESFVGVLRPEVQTSWQAGASWSAWKLSHSGAARAARTWGRGRERSRPFRRLGPMSWTVLLTVRGEHLEISEFWGHMWTTPPNGFCPSKMAFLWCGSLPSRIGDSVGP